MKKLKYAGPRIHTVEYELTDKGRKFLEARSRAKFSETHYNTMLTALLDGPKSVGALSRVIITKSKRPWTVAQAMIGRFHQQGWIKSVTVPITMDRLPEPMQVAEVSVG